MGQRNMGAVEMVHLDQQMVAPEAPLVVLVVHPIDIAAHPHTPPGFRWAVQVGQGPFSDLSRCPNAGWCPSRQEALLEGEMVAVTVVKTLRMIGIPAEYRVVETPADPIPAGGDTLPHAFE